MAGFPLLAVVVVAAIVIVLLLVGIARCTAPSTEDGSVSSAVTGAVGSSASAASQEASGAATSAAVPANVPDSSWRQAAGVPELTSAGTDPTAQAAALEAERVAANLAEGYQGVEDKWVPGGFFTTGDAELDQMVKAFCDDHANPELDLQDNAYNTFCAITWADYTEWEGNQYPRTYDWTVKYAKDFFERGGNCFSMAAANQWCLRYYGYTDAHAELVYELHKTGNWLEHGLVWTTDKADGAWKMLDTEMAANGWMMDADMYSVEILDPTSDWEPRASAYAISEMI